MKTIRHSPLLNLIRVARREGVRGVGKTLAHDLAATGRRWFGWRMLRRYLVVGGSMVTLVVFFYAIVNWTGQRAWKQFRAEWEAKGEHFDFRHFVPDPVQDTKNFGGLEVWKALFAYYREPRTDQDGPGNQDRMPPLSESFERRFDTYKTRNQITVDNDPEFGRWGLQELTDLTSWQDYYHELASKGEPETGFLPATIGGKPKSANPAHDVLLSLSKDDDSYRSMVEAMDRPYSRFPVQYEKNYGALLPHLSKLRSISMYAALKGVAELHAGSDREAFRTQRFLLQLPNTLESEPLLISQMVRIAMLQIGVQPLWEGMIDHRWTAEELESFQRLLDEYAFLKDLQLTWRAERAMSLEMIDMMMRNREIWGKISPQVSEPWLKKPIVEFIVQWMPDGVFYRKKLFYAQLMQNPVLSGREGMIQNVDPKNIQSEEEKVQEKLQSASAIYALNREFFPELGNLTEKFAQGQNTVHLTTVACSLEQYYLKEGRYPERVEELVSEYLEELPKDVILGGDLIYHRLSDAEYELYSVGWNGTDDGGITEKDGEKGDWVWKVVERGKLE